MDIKQKLQRFRAWQREPVKFENKVNVVVHCANCGTEFSDNFCPRCGQKADIGRVNWTTVRQGIMYLWGLDSRSLPHTLLQLFFRPGRLISDYISGKRQVSFPPIKMLFIVAIIFLLAGKLFGINDEPTAHAQETIFASYDAYEKWAQENPGWSFLAISSLLILPTWLLFRHSPLNNRHTLPEGFFIQVFMSTLLLIIAMLCEICDWFMWLVPLYYIITYWQLFGYNLWGTLWRTALCLSTSIMFILPCLFLSEYIITHHAVSKHSIGDELIAIIIIMVPVIIVNAIGYYIGKHTENQRLKAQKNDNT
ncbi:MAG: DUF3667 domain-containing protein [Muribaculaceae bacterium]|nr:DUF3667 domain-containing protein [Muribaculaceae bacterium]